MSDYAAFAAELTATGLVWDPWLDGAPRFAPEPLVLTARRHGELARAAEQVAAVHAEAVRLLAADERLLDDYLAPTPAQRAMWIAAAPHWHGIARADVFMTAAGPRVCELNSDTPSGQGEAVALGQLVLGRLALAAAARSGRAAVDPNAGLEARTMAMCERWAATVGAHRTFTAGIVYPTELPEDLSMIALYRGWFERRGHRVVLGSPFNITRAGDGRAALLGEPCDLVVRHYKTDWWGERQPVRDDEPPVPSAAPLTQPLAALLGAAIDGATAVVNPFAAVATQNKRLLALCWEEIERFPAAARAAIRRYVPRTVRLEVARESLWQHRADWVLKSDYGCEGSEVVVGAAVTQDEWEDALAHAIAQRWVAQEFFAATPEADGQITNHGVYVVAGHAAGLFVRRHEPPGPGGRGVTDARSRCAPVLVEVAAP